MAPSVLSTLLLLGAAVVPASAGLAAWRTKIGVQVILLNETTNQIRYSACNNRGEVRYSYTDGSVFSLDYKPKVGTPLAGDGWYANAITQASIFYLDEKNRIANAFYNCNMTTGMFEFGGNWIASVDVPSIHNNTGLAVVNLGEDGGYRVYYHDEDGMINELAYFNKQWRPRGPITRDVNILPALGAAFSGVENITVVSSRDSENIGVTRWNRDGSWFHTTTPRPLEGWYTTAGVNQSNITVNATAPYNYTLPAWDGNTKSVRITIDSAFMRYLWYIGNDSALHVAANQNSTWALRSPQSEKIWPKADEPNAEIAVAHEFTTSMVRIYYFVQGKLTEVRYEDGEWHLASAVGTPTAVVTTEPTDSSPEPTASAEEETGLSTGAKVGIGVGASLGAIAIGVIIAILVLIRRRKKKEALLNEHSQHLSPGYSDRYAVDGSTTLGPDTPYQTYGSPAWGVDHKGNPIPMGPSQLDSEPAAHQLDSVMRSELDYTPRQVYELPGNYHSHELDADEPQSQKPKTEPQHEGEGPTVQEKAPVPGQEKP